MSEGNGHPYSWSAIFNGYDEEYMKKCPFSVIPEYLSKQSFPEDTIHNAMVTHIWTQDKQISKDIAKATLIPNIVVDYSDMIGKVDAVLLARDDFDTHYEIAKKFIDAGLPIYIDKPLAITKTEANRIFNLEKYSGQIFTCSALRYAKEFNPHTIIEEVGEITHVESFVMKDWRKYAIHIIEPVLNIIGDHGAIISHKKIIERNTKTNVFIWETGLKTVFNVMGENYNEIKLVIIGKKGNKELVFNHTFYAFKAALKDFLRVVNGDSLPHSKEFVLNVIDIIERGD